MPNCPSCGQPYSEIFTFCEYCGYPLSSQIPKGLEETDAPCNCPGRALSSETANFCRLCGRPLFFEGPWQESLTLGSDEELVHSWEGFRAKQRGRLALTNIRLAWVERSRFREAYRVKVTIPLENVDGISLGGSSLTHVTIVGSHGSHSFELLSDSQPPELMGENGLSDFKKTVMDQANQRRTALEVARKKERVQVVLDFNFLRKYMEEGGLVIQKIACTSCGASMQVPTTGNAMSCQYCKATYHIEDVFERIKQIIDFAGRT